MEILICKSLLWTFGLSTSESYNATLDKEFLENPDSDILLQLEFCSSDCDATFDIINRYWMYECKDFSVDAFGKCLFEELKKIYDSNIFTIEDFGRKCYSLWQHFPEEFYLTEPFHTLSYADDCLSWGDEAQTRELYEEAFDFYK